MFELAFDEDAARLTLNRPAARNAFAIAGWDRLAETLDEAERSAPRLLEVTGAGGVFCAGADLSEFASLRDDAAATARFRLAMRRALDTLRAFPAPTAALVDGACYGAGVALAMACDLRVAAPGSRFAITPALMGISYPQEDVHRLVELVGPSQASRLLFSGEAIDAAEARRIGLIDMIGEWEGLRSAILANDRASLATLKRGISLAARGVRSDEEQDRDFDALFASDALATRLAGRRRG